MHHINGAYTTYFNTKRARAGHLFQGRYKAILVDMDEYAKELSRYIHLNPVRAKMVESLEEYAWSSYNSYIGEEKAPKWLCRDFILAYFGKKVSDAQNGYKKFVHSLVNEKYESPLEDVISSFLLGRPDFVDFIKDNFLSGKKPDKDLPALRQLIPRISMSEIFDEVELEFGDETVFARNLKMYLCWQHTGEKLKAIGSQFGISESGVSHACKRVKVKMKSNRKLKRKILKIEGKLTRSRFKT
jgi:hypothetical protein